MASLPRSSAVIGDGLRRLRTERGWSLYRLANETGLSESYLGLLESGQRDPKLSTLLKLARGLRIGSVELLLGPFGSVEAIEQETGQPAWPQQTIDDVPTPAPQRIST